MSSKLMDIDAILSENEQWMKLEEDWKPVDLETEEDFPPTMTPAFSTLDLKKTTFDSSFLFKKVRRKVGRNLSKKSAIVDYKEFIQDLQNAAKEPQPKQFYFINGQIISAVSVEEICDKIDTIFKSIEELCSATSTVRNRKGKYVPELVQCSISTGDLSFDDTVSEKEKSDGENVDRFIDEAFAHLSYTMAAFPDDDDEGTRESVTTLVNRFSSILNCPAINCSPRRQRQCCNRFKELADFWKNRAFDED